MVPDVPSSQPDGICNATAKASSGSSSPRSLQSFLTQGLLLAMSVPLNSAARSLFADDQWDPNQNDTEPFPRERAVTIQVPAIENGR